MKRITSDKEASGRREQRFIDYPLGVSALSVPLPLHKTSRRNWSPSTRESGVGILSFEGALSLWVGSDPAFEGFAPSFGPSGGRRSFGGRFNRRPQLPCISLAPDPLRVTATR